MLIHCRSPQVHTAHIKNMNRAQRRRQEAWERSAKYAKARKIHAKQMAKMIISQQKLNPAPVEQEENPVE